MAELSRRGDRSSSGRVVAEHNSRNTAARGRTASATRGRTGCAATSESAPIGRELVHGRKWGPTCRPPAARATRAARFIPPRNGTADRHAAASGNLPEPSIGTHHRAAVHQRARRSPG